MIPVYSPLMRSNISRGVTVACASLSQHIVKSVLLSDGHPIANRYCGSTGSSNVRHFGTTKATISSDPLDVLRKECAARKRCDDEGLRLKTTEHWALSIAIASSDAKLVRRHRCRVSTQSDFFLI
jgi:hypothetical protein